ncbi:hypothetical protein BAY61_32470 (plasmid) [Prauserella marina]|nr:hypothetical protein [Prauserella marina]ASR39997.1 hypothetical protein BAY61_32470 [Prauserella marina]
MADDQGQGSRDQGERPGEGSEPGEHGSQSGQFADGRRGQTREVSDEEAAAGRAADETSARAAGGDEPRRCGFSLCRKPLRDEGTGRKLEYCRKEDTSWDVGDERQPATCRELGRAERALATVTGARAAVAEVNVVELGEHVDAVIAPVQAVVEPVTRLLDTLTGVRGALDGAVATARAEKEEALRQAADADGRAEASRQIAVEAEAAAAAAVDEKEAAARAARRDRDDRVRAERAQATAEGRAAELEQALGRATERVDALTARTDDLAARLARASGELDSSRQTIEEERQRAGGQEERANAAIAAAADRERQLREEFDQRLEQLRIQHAAALDQARQDSVTAARQAREQGEVTRQAEAQRHAHQLAELHERIGTLSQRADAADGIASAQSDQLRAWRRTLAAALEQHHEDTEALRQQLRTLLDDQ